MNCHDDNDQAHDGREGTGAHKGHSGKGHMFMMAICCGLPILLLALLPLLSGIPGVNSLSKYIFLLCPILMIPMMFSMMLPSGTKNPKSSEAEHKHIPKFSNFFSKDMKDRRVTGAIRKNGER